MAPEATPARLAEDHFFFEPSSIDGPLYGRVHLPARTLDIGVVVVSPIGRERVRLCHEMTFLGRDIAAAGFPVLRFDYRGEGESGGEYWRSSITTRIDDTVAAADELRRRTGVQRVALVGIHIGAVIAGLAARDAGADFLVLCDPVCALQAYVKSLFRAAVLQQSQYLGRATALEPELRAGLRAGNLISIYAFPTGGALINELETVDIAPSLTGFRAESTILYFSDRDAPAPPALEEWRTLLGGPSRCAVSPVAMNFSWTTRKRWMPRLGPLNDAVVEWLRHRHPEQGDRPEPYTADRVCGIDQ